MHEQAWLVLVQLLRNRGVRTRNKGCPMGVGSRRIVGDGPHAVVSATRGHLPFGQHVEAIRASPTCIVERMQHHGGAQLLIGGIDLWPAGIITDGQTDFDSLNVARHQTVTGGIVPLIAEGTH